MINVRNIGGKLSDQILRRKKLWRAAERRIASAPTISSHEFEKDTRLAENNDFPFVVSTRSRHAISMKPSHDSERTGEAAGLFQVPLTVSDVHLRHEQLPFAYFFQETLDAASLKDSLHRVLQHFPVVSGRIRSQTFQEIICDPTKDTVPLAFGDINATLDQWFSESRGHSHVSGGGHPVLLPIFDALFENERTNGPSEEGDDVGHVCMLFPYDNMLRIRVTYFQCGGTAIGVNFLHALGDTASCVRFVQCWGREMQRTKYPLGASNERASVCVSGMMTEDRADLMGIFHRSTAAEKTGEVYFSWLRLLRDVWVKEYSSSSKKNCLNEPATDSTKREKACQHEYLQLCFSPEVLSAMREVGIEGIERDCQREEVNQSFTSTNDLVTAFGWLLKRSLSGEATWNISMVVNMRGRCGIDSFVDMRDSGLTYEKHDTTVTDSGEDGMFGNGIANIVAVHPATSTTFDVWDVASAAQSIRKSLIIGVLALPDRLHHSSMGNTSSAGISNSRSFPTTSWGQFPLGDVSFSATTPLFQFHGHPSHPLPKGQSTYASVITRTLKTTSVDGDPYGMNYDLLLPSSQVDHAIEKHVQLCEAFLAAQSKLRLRKPLGIGMDVP